MAFRATPPIVILRTRTKQGLQKSKSGCSALDEQTEMTTGHLSAAYPIAILHLALKIEPLLLTPPPLVISTLDLLVGCLIFIALLTREDYMRLEGHSRNVQHFFTAGESFVARHHSMICLSSSSNSAMRRLWRSITCKITGYITDLKFVLLLLFVESDFALNLLLQRFDLLVLQLMKVFFLSGH